MAIVWPCPLSVDAYLSAGRDVEVPRPSCPGCDGAMTWWSGYRRFVRAGDLCEAIFVPRVRCGPCAKTHAVLPAFVLTGRLDVVESIGSAIEAVVHATTGVRPVAVSLGVPHTTARGWLRRFGKRARQLAAAFAALAGELGGALPEAVGDPARLALRSIGAAFDAACGFGGWACLGRWRFAGAVSGGRLMATNTNTPYLFVGSRRFMPPIP